MLEDIVHYFYKLDLNKIIFNLSKYFPIPPLLKFYIQFHFEKLERTKLGISLVSIYFQVKRH